jgi:hypothetical protein
MGGSPCPSLLRGGDHHYLTESEVGDVEAFGMGDGQ